MLIKVGVRGSGTVGRSGRGVTLGRRLEGDPVLSTSGGDVVWGFDDMRRHALVVGRSGVGKTETAMRIAYEVASAGRGRVFYLDAKGDRKTAARFVGVMEGCGLKTRVFPNEHFDGWRGDWRAIVNRLLQVVPFVEEGPASYYRDIAKIVLQLACNQKEGPPRSSRELLNRLDYGALQIAHAGRLVAQRGVSVENVTQVRMRYESFFGQLGRVLDGQWAWEDADAAYVLLDSLALKEDTASAGSLLLEDFVHYFSQRKAEEEFCVLIVDEFAAVASSSDVVRMVEQARGFNTSLVLAPQTVSGIGSFNDQARIFGAVEVVIAHATNEPERVSELAGTRRGVELTYRLEEDGPMGRGLARMVDRPTVDVSCIRRLRRGEAYVIVPGSAARVAIGRAPEVKGELPEAEAVDWSLDERTMAMPEHLDVYEVEEGAG